MVDRDKRRTASSSSNANQASAWMERQHNSSQSEDIAALAHQTGSPPSAKTFHTKTHDVNRVSRKTYAPTSSHTLVIIDKEAHRGLNPAMTSGHTNLFATKRHLQHKFIFTRKGKQSSAQRRIEGNVVGEIGEIYLST